MNRSPRAYKVAVYWRDDDGIWHYHGTWEDTAANPADAKRQAIDALSDVRITDPWKAEIINNKSSSLS